MFYICLVAFGHDEYKSLSVYQHYFGYGEEYKQEVGIKHFFANSRFFVITAKIGEQNHEDGFMDQIRALDSVV